MDDEFDLYGDADIYGGGEGVKEEEASTQPAADSAMQNDDKGGDGLAGSKRPRDDRVAENVKTEPSFAGSSTAPGGSQHGANVSSASAVGRQEPVRPSDEPIDPASARLALAGRPKVVDPNVQNSLYVGELDWWVSDEDIRKIANDNGISLLLQDVTFSEHKVNGKSKGVAFVELRDEDEARRLKDWFENNDVNFKRATITMASSASGNPFKTLPKDPPPREARPQRGGMRGGMAMGARENNRRDNNAGLPQNPQSFPMAGAPIRMGGSSNGGVPGGMPMMNPMMMGMMGGGGGGGGGGSGRPPFGNPMAFMGGPGGRGGGGGGNSGWGARGRGAGHFNPNFFGGMQGMGGGAGRGGGASPSGSAGGGDDRDRKRYRPDDGGY